MNEFQRSILDRLRGRVYLTTIKPRKRKDNFKPYTEPFRPFNEEEFKSFVRLTKNTPLESVVLVSYQAQTGGFTICNIILDNKLYSGSSHCSKVDRWLPIRGQMLAFRRALESEGVELSQPPHTGETVTNG